MSLTTEIKDGYALITVNNDRLDTFIAPKVKSEISEINKVHGLKNIIIDIDKCDFCDSSGLSSLLFGNRLCNDNQGFFIIVSPHPNVKKLITISMLDDILNLFDSEEAACEALKANS